MNKQKGISTFFAILTVGIIAIIGFAIFYSYQYIWAPEEETTIPQTETPEGVKTPKTETPYIEVLSPNGGENWRIGERYDITWKSAGVEKVNIGVLWEGAEEAYFIDSNVNTLSETYSWEIPEFFTNLVNGPKFKILITNTESEPDITDISDSYFSIITD